MAFSNTAEPLPQRAALNFFQKIQYNTRPATRIRARDARTRQLLKSTTFAEIKSWQGVFFVV